MLITTKKEKVQGKHMQAFNLCPRTRPYYLDENKNNNKEKIDIYDGLALSLTKKSRSPNPIPAECHAPINCDVISILLHATLFFYKFYYTLYLK